MELNILEQEYANRRSSTRQELLDDIEDELDELYRQRDYVKDEVEDIRPQ